MLRTFFAERQQALGVVATTVTHQGEKVDWIVRQAQPILLKPPPMPADVAASTPTPGIGLQPDELGPEGTVPVQHFDADDIDDQDLPRSIAEYLARKLPPTVCKGNYCHYYAHMEDDRTNATFGTAGNIEIANPSLYRSDEFSLGQNGLAAVDGSGVWQTVEVGWHVDPAEYTSNQYGTHLFTFYTTDHYGAQGKNLGGYNADYVGWVQSSSTKYPGMLLLNQGGSPYENYIAVALVPAFGAVLVAFDGEWIGYYPTSLFAATGLANSGDFAMWQGEITDYTPDGVTTRTDMGTGAYASAHQAWFRQLNTYTDGAGDYNAFQNSATLNDKSGCWSMETHYAPAPDSWGGTWWFYYGGPGYNPPSCP